MKGLPTATFLMLAFAASTSSATHAICFFSVPSEKSAFDLEFSGNGGLTQIYHHEAPNGPFSLPFELFDFDYDEERVHLTYVNPGSDTLPPSFTLLGSGERVRVILADRELVGILDCKWWEITSDD